MNLPGIEPASSPEGRFFEFIFMIKILIYSCYSVRIFEKCFSSKKKSKWIRSDLCIWKIRQILIFCHWKFSSFDLVISDVDEVIENMVQNELEDNT